MRHLILAGALVAGCGGCDTRPPHSIKFLGLNVANGNDARYRTPEARAAQREFVRSRAPDVVALQEVDRGTARVGFVNTDDEILPRGTTAFCEERSVDVGTSGNSLWFRDGITVLEQWAVGLDYSAWVDGKLASEGPRQSICARARNEFGREFSVCNVHLTAGARFADGTPAPDGPIRQRQLAETAGFDTDVIMGDFNALDFELAPQLEPLGYRPATHGELEAVWWKLEGSGTMIPLGAASDHPGAAEAVSWR